MKAGKGSCQPFFCALFSLPLQGMTKAILHIFAALILAVSCSSAGSEAENMRAWYAEGCSLGEEGDHYGAILSLTKAMNCAIRLDDKESLEFIEAQISKEYAAVDDVSAATTLLVSSQLELEQARLRESRMKMGALLLFVVAILSTLILYLIARKSQAEKRLAEEEAENDRLMSIAEDLRSKASAAGKKQKGRSSDTLDRLCEQYYVYEGTDNLQGKILKEVKAIVDGLRSDPKAQKDLEKGLNEDYDEVVKKLREQMPKIKEEDILLFCFSASGFSSTTISTLLEKDKPYVYNRLYRLKSRISSSDAPDKELFLSLL